MKKLLIGAGAVVALLVLAALAAPSFVDWNAYRPQLVAAVKEATGRELAIDGGLDLALLPAPELSAKGLRLASVPGATEPDMALIKELEVRVALLPLLAGEVKVESVRLIEPAIVLEELKDGRNNWTFEPTQEEQAAGPAAPSEEGGSGFAFSLDDVEVRGASVTYRSQRTGAEERITGLSFDGSAGSLHGPFDAKGELQRAGRPIAFDASVGALQAGRAAPVRLAVGLKGGEATAEFSGLLSGAAADLRLAGKLKAGTANLAKALGESAPLLAKPLALEAAVEASTEAAAANDLRLSFGETQAGGAVSMAFGAEPRFDATLGATRLDLDTLLAAAGTAPEAKALRAGGGRSAGPKTGGFALPAGLSGALTATIDGVVYRDAVIRQAQLAMELADGKLAVKRLAALLPGGSDATLSGAVTTAGGKPQFDGRLEVASDNLRGLLSWLRIEPAGAPMERLNTASLTTALRVTPELAEFANVNLRLDGSTITGGAAYRLQERPSFAVDLAVDRLNLDGYLAAPEPGTQAAPKEAQKKDEAQQQGGLAALNGFDANVKVRVAQLVYNRAPLKSALVDATLAGGKLTLRQARAQDQTGATISASGSASDFAATPKFQAELALAADDLSGLAQLAGFRAADAPAKLGRTDLKASLDGSFEAVGFKAAGALAGGSLNAEGKASGLQTTPTFDAAVKTEHQDLVALVRNFGVDWRPAAQKLGLSVDLAAKGDAAALELPTLKIKAGPASVEGAARLKLDGARPYLNANLQASEIVLDQFLPASADRPARAQGAQEAAPARPAEPRWSREPLDLSALQGFDADVQLAAQRIAFRDYPFQEPRLALALKDGTLSIGELTGKLFQGAVALKGELASKPQPALALDVKLDGADVQQALAAAMGLDKVSGRLDFTGAFRAAGRSEWELVNSLSGDAKLSLGEGALRGVDLASLSARLAELDGPAAFVDLATRSFSGGETRIQSASGTWQVKGGVATTRDTRAVLDAAQATLEGDVNLAAWRMDLRSEVALTEHPKAPPLAVTLRGPLDNPQRDVKTQAMEQYLAARIGSELLKKGLGEKAGPLGEILGGGTGRQPPAQNGSSQPPPAQQAIEGLLKGLLKK